MAKKLQDLYKIEKKVSLEDNNKNEAVVLLRIIPNSVKQDALVYANGFKAEMIKKLNDSESADSVVLEDSIVKLTKELLDIEVRIYARASQYVEQYKMLAKSEKYKDISEEDLDNNDDFIKELDGILEQETTKYMEKLTDEESLRDELRKFRKEAIINSFFMESFNQYLLFNALRDIEDTNKTYFESIEDMMDNLHGDMFSKLLDEYYSINLSVDEVKN